MSFIIDASIALSWFFPDEKNDHADRALTELYRTGAVVPGLWSIEVGNALIFGLRRKRISDEAFKESMTMVQDVPLEVEPVNRMAVASSLPKLAIQFGLTLYDAHYLELATRRALPLATFDKDLMKAASLAGVNVWMPT